MNRNNELLKEIGLTLETIAGKINVALGPCNKERCSKYDITHLNNCTNGRGPCLYHEHESGRPLGCLAVCRTTGCPFKDKIHPTCYAQAVCSLRLVVPTPRAIPDPAHACDEPCTHAFCVMAYQGLCTAPKVCCIQVLPTEDASDGFGKPCNELCGNSKCEFNEEDGNLCLQLEPCGLIMDPGTPPPCEEPCSKTACGENKGGLLCTAHITCMDHTPPTEDTCEPERLQGYTLEQWEQIRAGGYLCQFTNVTNDGRPDWKKPVARLDQVGGRWDGSIPHIAFLSESGKGYIFCRPAELPGVLRPWFGGDCPVPKDTRVMVILGGKRVGKNSGDRAGDYHWGLGGNPWINITAFMVLPE